MVRDWLKLSEASFHEKRLVPLFHATPTEQHLQKIYLLKYLLNFYDENKAKEYFKDICCENNSIIDEEYSYLVKSAKKQMWPKRKEVYFFISQDEIDYINSISAPREFRLYILGILAYGKYTKQQVGVPLFNIRDRSYIYYLTTHTDEFNIGKRRSTYLSKMFSDKSVNHGLNIKPVRVPKSVISFDANWIQWNLNDGYCILDIERDVYRLTDLIQDWFKECPECHNKFMVAKKSKTNLCSYCYNIYRHKYKAEKEAERRKNIENGQE